VVKTPILYGYYADTAEIPAVSDVTAGSQNRVETVIYRRLAALVPTFQDDGPRGIYEQPYMNDMTDPTKPAPVTVPVIEGYQPYYPDATNQNKPGTPLTAGAEITPNHPGNDTPVLYVLSPQKARVEYIDDATNTILETITLTGVSNQPIDYQTAETIAAYVAKGYELKLDEFPTNPIFDRDTNLDQVFKVQLTPRLVTVTPAKPGVPGTPVDSDNPTGPKWPDGSSVADLSKTITETITYLYKDGGEASPTHHDSVTFTRDGQVNVVTGNVTYGSWVATGGDTTFDAVATPVVPGYYADKASVDAVKELSADSSDIKQTVTYDKLGSLVPSSPDSKFPETAKVPFTTDQNDPTKAGTVTVPNVPGYTPHYVAVNDPNTPGAVIEPGATITPANPGTDISVIYTGNPQVAVIKYIDATDGTVLEQQAVNGTTFQAIPYKTADTINKYKIKGYVLKSDGFPAGTTFDSDDKTDQDFEVILTPRLVTVTPAKPGVPGTPVDSDNQTGPKWPKDSGLTNLSKTITETIAYLYKDGGEASPTHHDSVTFTRTGEVNVVTGNVTYGSWVAKDNDTTFDTVKTPVIPGYYADKAEIGAVTNLTVDSSNVQQKVIYDKLGALVPTSSDSRFPLKEKIPFSGDPTDATKPGTVVVPSVPGYTPYQADPTRPGRLQPIQPGTVLTPETPDTDSVITYVPIPVVTSAKPVIPVKPEKPSKPTEPATPTIPADPADSGSQVTTGKPNKPVAVVKPTGTIVSQKPTRLAIPETDGKVSQKASGSTEKTFPQTGDSPASELTLAGVVGLLSLTLIGLAQRRKEKEE